MLAIPDLSTVQWRKSTYSNQEAHSLCVEVAVGIAELTPVRDSKTPNRAPLLFTSRTWRTFVTSPLITP